jgi:dipeptidyl aminopeptidase/acylaminoacyl peptidase
MRRFAPRWRRLAAWASVSAALALPLAGPGTALGAGAPSTTFPLTVDSIMRGPAVVGYAPSALRWSGDSQRLYFEWRPRGEDEAATWEVARTCLAGSPGVPPPGARVFERQARGTDAVAPATPPSSSATSKTCEPQRLTDDERRLAPPAAGAWDPAHRRSVGIVDGDVVVVDTVARTRTLITRTAAAEGHARWSDGGRSVTFVRDQGLYRVWVDRASDQPGTVFEQLTDAGPARPRPGGTDSQQFVRAEEAQLLTAVRESEARKTRAEARKDAQAIARVAVAERQSVEDLVLAHQGTVAYALIVEKPAAAHRADVPAYLTASAYPELLPGRPLVGDAQEVRRLVAVDLAAKRESPVSLGGPAVDPRAGPLLWSLPVVSSDGRHAATIAVSADNKHRYVAALGPTPGAARIVEHLQDAAWVRALDESGPPPTAIGFVPNTARLWFLSERDGWMHLYVADLDAPDAGPRQLTSGPWEITDAELSPDGTRFVIVSTEADAAERHVYTLPVDGGPRTRLTAAPGAHALELSPDGATWALLSSFPNRPPEVFLASAPAGGAAIEGSAMVPVTTSPTAEWLGGEWIAPRVVSYKARDGATVRARLYTPEMVGAKRKRGGPAVIFVHGAGYLQNAHRYWSYYYREYMFHHLLASKGYVVLDPDYRGSAGYGRDWRTGIYRHMGGHDLNDVVDGATWLVATEKVDARRLGVYGGSYGGFITLMAMFTTPDVFAAGAALRPVTDWSRYNHEYTSSILNEPQTDPAAYRRSSPIYFADGLRGALLICHGLVDVNVHAQDSIRLAQRLIELRKEHWELALYPAEDHAFERETSWADEYKRILTLFETWLE